MQNSLPFYAKIYHQHHYPAEVISHAVWFYQQFPQKYSKSFHKKKTGQIG